MRVLLIYILLASCACAQKKLCPNTVGKWPHLPILINDNTNDRDTAIALEESIGLWNRVLKKNIFVKHNKGAKVFYTNEIQNPEQGRTFIKWTSIWDSTPSIYTGYIILNPSKQYDATSLLIHELGHLAGLEHNTKGYKNTMDEYLGRTQQRRYIDQWSIDRMECLYGSYDGN